MRTDLTLSQLTRDRAAPPENDGRKYKDAHRINRQAVQHKGDDMTRCDGAK